jgi:hypothetical protein
MPLLPLQGYSVHGKYVCKQVFTSLSLYRTSPWLCQNNSSSATFFLRSLKIMLRQGPFGLHTIYRYTRTYLLVLLPVLCDRTVFICSCVKSFCASQ